MRRRQFARLVGGSIAGAGLLGHVSAREAGDTPNDNVSDKRITPFSSEDDPDEVSTGTWISHALGWVDKEGGDSTKADVERFIDVVEVSATIDGEEIEDTEEYWGDVHYDDDYEAYIGWWEYSTPPKSPGTYEFTIEFYYPDGFYDSGNEVREPGRRDSFTGYYEVTPKKGKDE